MIDIPDLRHWPFFNSLAQDLVYEENADWRGDVDHRSSLVGQSSGGLIYAVGGDGVGIGACGQ